LNSNDSDNIYFNSPSKSCPWRINFSYKVKVSNEDRRWAQFLQEIMSNKGHSTARLLSPWSTSFSRTMTRHLKCWNKKVKVFVHLITNPIKLVVNWFARNNRKKLIIFYITRGRGRREDRKRKRENIFR